MWPEDEKVVEKTETDEPATANRRVVVPKIYTRFDAFIYWPEAFTPLLELGQSSRRNPNASRGKRASGVMGSCDCRKITARLSLVSYHFGMGIDDALGRRDHGLGEESRKLTMRDLDVSGRREHLYAPRTFQYGSSFRLLLV